MTFLRQLLLILIGQPTHSGNTPDEIRRNRAQAQQVAQAQQMAQEQEQKPNILRDGWVIVREFLYAAFAQPK